jgi:hypothetical protein
MAAYMAQYFPHVPHVTARAAVPESVAQGLEPVELDPGEPLGPSEDELVADYVRRHFGASTREGLA